MPSLLEGGFHTWKLAHIVIEEKILWSWFLTVGPSNSSACPIQKSHIQHFPIFSTYEPDIGSGAHTVSNTDFSMLLELHRLQPNRECWELLLPLSAETGTNQLYQLGRGGNHVEGWDPKIFLSRHQLALPLVNQALPFEEPLVPSHDSYSFKDPTYTNIYKESVRHLAGQAILPTREQSCRGPPSYNLCAPHPLSNACLDELKVLWVLMNIISLDVYQQYHTNNNSVIKAKKRSPSEASLRRCRQCFGKIMLSTYGLLLVTAGYWESCSLMIHLLHSSAQVISNSPQKYCDVPNCAKSLNGSDTLKKKLH